MKLRKKTVLELIVEYQVANRQVGHTSLMLGGAALNKASLIVVAGMNHRDHMMHNLAERGWSLEEAKNACIALYEIKSGKLLEFKGRPLVIDNLALFEIAMDVAEDRKQLMEEMVKAEQPK